jgi:hypothetical protein
MIQPQQTEKFEITMNAGIRRGPFNKKINVTTNDREQQSLQIECVANVKAAFALDPPSDTINFGSVRRSYPAQSQTLTITRGDGGPIHPELVSTGNPQIRAEVKEIEPGEKYELEVGISPPWPNGMLRTIMNFTTGVEQAPSQTLSVFANVTPRLQSNPARFTVRPAENEENELVAHLLWDGDPGQVLEATVSDAKLAVELRKEGEQQVVALRIPEGYGTAARGNACNVVLKTDDPDVPSLQIPVAVIGPTPVTPKSPFPPGATLNSPPGLSGTAPSSAGPGTTSARDPRLAPAPTTQPVKTQ